jgi:hypothetical protein
MVDEKHPFYFLTSDEAMFFKSFCSLIIPSGNSSADPGAEEVGTINYVDSTLFDFPKEVQEYYRGAVVLVNEKAHQKSQVDFFLLSTSDKDGVLRQLFLDPKTRERIFDLRSLALEGFYSDFHDPWYKGVTPWELVKFRGRRISELKKDWSFLKVWRENPPKGE